MDIHEALEKLSGFYDMLASTGFSTDEELEMFAEIEDTIYAFVEKHQPSK